MSNYMFRPIHAQTAIKQGVSKLQQEKRTGGNFTEHLQNALQPAKQPLTVSKHARDRLTQRGIQIDDEKWANIGEKVQEAKKLGVKESLVLMKDAALIVSAKNHTVITAMDRNEAETQIFTNINGTIVMD